MLYCEKCRSLFDINVCPFCGNKKVRDPKENDAVYLTAKNSLFSGMLKDVLTKNHIPYMDLRRGSVGSFVSNVPSGFSEEYRFYVPYGAYEKAKELLEEFFDGN